MAGWTITTWSFVGATTTGAISGANAVISGLAPYLEFDDTNAGGQNFRWNDLTKTFFVTWFNGSTWQTIGRFTDPNQTLAYWELVGTGLSFTGLAVGPQNVLRQIIGVEANPRFQWDTNAKMDWGPGGASAVDTTLQRIAAGVLQTSTLRGTAAPSNVADLTRKDYVDAQIATTVLKAGSTMTGALILSGDPTVALGAATKQYVDASGTGATTFATGAVLFGQNTKIPAVDTANFFWDSTNHRLGIGNGAPAFSLDVTGIINVTSKIIAPNIGPTTSQQHTLPAVASDTIALLAAAQTLTNKTITAPVLSGTATGTYTLAGTPTITSPMISGPTVTGTAAFQGAINPSGTRTTQTAISVGASPFTYTNSDNQLETVYIAGGTVTDISIIRNATTTTLFTVAGDVSVLLSAGDAVKVTYSVAPTMIKVPV